jgi:hypothetical protein
VLRLEADGCIDSVFIWQPLPLSGTSKSSVPTGASDKRLSRVFFLNWDDGMSSFPATHIINNKIWQE